MSVTVGELRADDAVVRVVAALRCLEWVDEEGSTTVEDWEVLTRSECRHDGGELPFTLVARDRSGTVVGAVGLVEHDPEGLSDRFPVGGRDRRAPRSAGRRRRSVAVAALHRRASRPGVLWVSTQHAAPFYVRCGYSFAGEGRTVLSIGLAAPG